MRRRRVDRCVLRAAVAIDAGVLQEARAALEEVERLDPHEPAIEPLRAKLAAAESPPPVEPPVEAAAVAVASPVVVSAVLDQVVLNPAVPDTPAPEEVVPDTPTLENVVADTPALDAPFLAAPETSRRVFPASAAAVLIAFSGAVGWFLFSQNLPADPAGSRTDPSLVYDSKPVNPRSTPPAPQPDAQPAVRVAETDVTAAATSEPAAEPAAPVATAGGHETPPDAPSVAAPDPAPAPTAAAAAPSNTSTMATTSTPPPTPPVERRAIQASLAPSPSLPDPVPAASVAPAPGAVPAVAGTEGVALSGTSVTLSPPVDPPAPAPVSTPPPPSPPPVAATSSASQAGDESQVRALLHRYEAAYSALDAAAASAVWPGVDRRALTSAFQALSSQSVSLGRCDVRVNGNTAQADCKGTARWVPKVGAGPQTAARQWWFDLRSAGGDWIITRATVR